jgi:23S rRNA pseudouridine1911/1915/1917 synthase
MLHRVDKIQTGSPDPRQRPQPEEGPLSILFEDDAIIVLDKPPGLVIHPTYKNTSGTLLNAVLWRYRNRPGVQPGILTRLDKDTSGVVVIALAPALHARMQKDMIGGHVRKEYLAVVSGRPAPSAGRIDLPLGRSAADRRIVVVRDDGARCETHYEVVQQLHGGAVVRCELKTGRTHQIRVHLAASGWPVIGDRVYFAADKPNGAVETGSAAAAVSREDAPIARQALHAWRVTFPHPVTREEITMESPLPADMRALIAAL